MRTDSASTHAPVLDRVRAEFARARRRLAKQPQPLRWGLVLGALAVAAALVYAASGPAIPSGGFLRSGEAFSSDSLTAIRRELSTKHIPCEVDGRNRVRVALDQLDAANDAVAKLGVGPRTFAAIDDKAFGSSIWDTPTDREQRQEQAANERLAAMILPMDGILDARVSVKRPKNRGRGRGAPAASAFVYLETAGDRKISDETVESIQRLVSGAEPDVDHEAVSVFDRKGRHYLDARNPTVGLEAKNRAREEGLRRQIAGELDWIKGAQVSVQLVSAAALPVNLAATPLPAPPAAAPVEELRLPEPEVGVNSPLELTPPPAAPPVKPATAALSPAPAPPSTQAAEASRPSKARVWVKVPHSFYLKAVARREPSLDDFQPLVDRTKRLVEKAVRHVVPPDQLDEVVVDTIPEVMPERDAPAPASASAQVDARRALTVWVPAGVGLGSAAAGLAVAFRVLAGRRPALRAASGAHDVRGRYVIDEPTDSGPGPGPSERVRELIRQNPEAAASVLHRWTGQGGTIG